MRVLTGKFSRLRELRASGDFSDTEWKMLTTRASRASDAAMRAAQQR
jgi:hypothetical protein